MNSETKQPSRVKRAALGAVAAFFLLSIGLFPSPAHSIDPVDMSALQERVDATQDEVERTSAAYKDATAAAKKAREAAREARTQVATLEAQIAESQETIERVSAALVEQKDRSAEAMRLQYKMEAEGISLRDVVLTSETLEDVFTSLDYMDYLQEFNSSEMSKYASMKDEYSAALATAEAAKKEADKQKVILEEAEQQAAAEEERATLAMEEAIAAREKAQAEAEEEIARREEELAAIGEIEDTIDWRAGRDAFVQEWTERIDAYLAGSAMAGCGKAFAEAAWDFGVDPRWSPAVSTIESGKGAAVPYYTSNNAWGWMANETNFRTFSSFEEGARLHVEYLARYYGYTVTLDHAKVYCPPNAEKWYMGVVNEMRLI